MKSQDLEVDKIYYQKSHYEYIFKCSVKGMCRYSFGINLATKGFNKDTDCIYEQKELREATFSERLWLQKCIDANKFISKEEALKDNPNQSDITEYIECIGNKDKCNYLVIGRIYKYIEMSGPYYKFICNLKCDSYSPGSNLYAFPEDFKPSTKEAFDLQNKSIEEKWIPKVGDWVVSLGDFISFKKGSIGQITEVNDGYGLKVKSIKIDTQTFTGECADEFRLATQDEIGKHLIEEAKKRYPPDTLFYPAHVPTVKDTCLRRPEYHFYYEKGYIYLRNEKNLVVNMNSGYSYCVYYNGTWAKIVNQSEFMSKEELLAKAKTLYKIGDKILPLRPFGASGTYGEDTISNALQYNDEGIYGGIGYVYLFKTSQWAEIISKPEVKEEIKLVNHSDVGLEYPLSCGSHDLNNTKIEYVDYTYNGNSYKHKSKVNELKVLSQQIPVVFKKKVKKHYLQTI